MSAPGVALRAALACCAVAAALAAQAADGAPAVVAVGPDAAAPPFVAFARERAAPARGGPYHVTIWSVDPASREVARRVVLGRSSWNVGPLFDAPDLLRWHVPERPDRFRLLRLSCATFAVDELLRAPRLGALGRAGERAYLQTTAAPFALDVATGARTALPDDFRVLATNGDDWLVVADGAVARMSAANGEITRRYAKVQPPPAGHRRAQVPWDGGRFAVCLGRFVDADRAPVGALEFMVPSVVYREVWVWDLEDDEQSSRVVRTQARGGSGEPVIPIAMPTELVGGMFRYAERRPAAGASANLDELDWERDFEWVTIDVATGEELLRVPYHERLLPAPAVPDAEAVPEYLRAGFDASPIRAWGAAQDLAHAFLTLRGVDVELPDQGVVKLDAVARSADGQRLLVLHRGTFYACDLGAKELAQWPAPAALAAAAVELHAVGADREPLDDVQAPPPGEVKRLGLAPFYRRYLSADGFPILASEKVSPFALREARYLIDRMLDGRDDVRRKLIDNEVRFAIMAPDELTTAIPEHSDLEPSKYWDRRARGLGATRHRPAVSCGEENLLGYPGDPYHQECILIHEFAHAIHAMALRELDPTFDRRLRETWQRAMKKGLWKGKYAATNHSEYWAEGVQSWFDDNRPPDHDHNHVDTRVELVEYDPDLAALIREVFGEPAWRYEKPADRPADGRAHLEGYDPAAAKAFRWPPELEAWYRDYMSKKRRR